MYAANKRQDKKWFDEGEKSEYDISHYNRFKWNKSKNKNYWSNSVDCIMVEEFEIIE